MGLWGAAHDCVCAGWLPGTQVVEVTYWLFDPAISCGLRGEGVLFVIAAFWHATASPTGR